LYPKSGYGAFLAVIPLTRLLILGNALFVVDTEGDGLVIEVVGPDGKRKVKRLDVDPAKKIAEMILSKPSQQQERQRYSTETRS
jgi:hypothetical protein